MGADGVSSGNVDGPESIVSHLDVRPPITRRPARVGLSGSKTGFAFRRQLVFGEHIVDFACTKVRLVVEVDGAYHEERARHDAARGRALGRLPAPERVRAICMSGPLLRDRRARARGARE